jgi:hypothetical protein
VIKERASGTCAFLLAPLIGKTCIERPAIIILKGGADEACTAIPPAVHPLGPRERSARPGMGAGHHRHVLRDGTDTTGAVIAGATATMTHVSTGARTTKTTGAGGVFVFDFMRVGNYALRNEAPGFKAYEGSGIELTAGQQIRQTFVLDVGAISDTVTVAAASPLVNVASAEQLQTFDHTKVTELPLPRRNFSSLLRTGTGVTYTGDSVRMNGVGKNGVAFSVDGTDAGGNPEGRNSSNYLQPNLIDIMSVEAIQEVHTVKGIAPAEYGNMERRPVFGQERPARWTKDRASTGRSVQCLQSHDPDRAANERQ